MKRLIPLAASCIWLASAAVAEPTSIPSGLVSTPKELWRAVMAEFYGKYDKREKCWVKTFGDQQHCMRPHVYRDTDNEGRIRVYLAIAGRPLGEGNDCHACGGSLGFVILEAGGSTLELIARSEPAMPFGAWGTVPAEENFTLVKLGDPNNFAWAVTTGWAGQGVQITDTELFAVVDGGIKSVGLIPQSYDDSGNCENGKHMLTGGGCTDVSYETIYEAETSDTPFAPIELRGKGVLEGAPFTTVFVERFDPVKKAYVEPEGIPRP